ncbi:ATP-binding protein [uncultured Roseibium sp.]|uniref:ATP-binding protein n=1 Tax=uncultured Roseibium sp. TaxID=1936171 RepID=UPI002606D6A8|nr:ATP-binding protein [uncultured Roseibium sp.]
MRWANLTLRGQVTFVVIASWLVLEVISVLLDVVQIRQARLEELKNRGDGFLREVVTTLGKVPPEDRVKLALSLNNAERSVVINAEDTAASVAGGRRYPAVAEWFKSRLEAQGISVAALSVADRVVNTNAKQKDDFAKSSGLGGLQEGAASEAPVRPIVGVYSVRLADETIWINCYLLLAPENFWPVLFARSVDSLIGLVLVGLLALLIGRVMAPLSGLAENAERLGRGEEVGALKATGSADIRDTVTAFNQMEARIVQALEYKTALLRSLGHDLKSPLARLKAEMDHKTSTSTKLQLHKQLENVEEIVNAVTTFTRETRRDGDVTRIDLPSLLEVLVEEQQDDGHDATLVIQSAAIVCGRHNALTRAVRNLIENAIKYGTCARVTLSTADGSAVICVEDEGPGIPPEQMDAAFEPFQRLGASGPGSGLGLSIVRAIIVDQGGSITLANRSVGGLSASVFLPIEG